MAEAQVCRTAIRRAPKPVIAVFEQDEPVGFGSGGIDFAANAHATLQIDTAAGLGEYL